MDALGQHVVLALPRRSAVVTRSRPYLMHLIDPVLAAAIDSAIDSGWASAQPIHRAHEGLEAGELDVGVDAAAPDGAAGFGL